MKGTAYLQGALAFLPGQLWLVLCIGVLVALAATLVVVSIVFGGNRRRGEAAQVRKAEGGALKDTRQGPG